MENNNNTADATGTGWENMVSLAERAYDRIENLIVQLDLRPGQFLTVSELQKRTGLGRTPVLDATRKLADDTLLIILPRRGLQVAPIDLARDKRLMALRRGVEDFVARLAAERAPDVVRSQMRQIVQQYEGHETTITMPAFTRLDRLQDRLIVKGAGEPFVEQTLRPLHAVYRRDGCLYHKHLGTQDYLEETVQLHRDVLRAIIAGRPDDAARSTAALMDFAEAKLQPLADQVDPREFNLSLEPVLSP